jgi:hypothetical protein
MMKLRVMKRRSADPGVAPVSSRVLAKKNGLSANAPDRALASTAVCDVRSIGTISASAIRSIQFQVCVFLLAT